MTFSCQLGLQEGNPDERAREGTRSTYDLRDVVIEPEGPRLAAGIYLSVACLVKPLVSLIALYSSLRGGW